MRSSSHRGPRGRTRLEAERSSPTSLGTMLLFLFTFLLLLVDAGAFRYFPQSATSAGLHKLVHRATVRDGEQKALNPPAQPSLKKDTRPKQTPKPGQKGAKVNQKGAHPKAAHPPKHKTAHKTNAGGHKAPPKGGQAPLKRGARPADSVVLKALLNGNSKMDKKDYVRELYRVIPDLGGADLASVLLSIRDLRLSSRSRVSNLQPST
jgi:hypothetical protein